MGDWLQPCQRACAAFRQLADDGGATRDDASDGAAQPREARPGPSRRQIFDGKPLRRGTGEGAVAGLRKCAVLMQQQP